MFGKISRPVIGFLTGSFIFGCQTRVMSATMNPTTTNLELNIQSSRIPKSYEVGGVGLGILTVIEKLSEDGSTKIRTTRTLCRRNMICSKPIAINSVRIEGGSGELNTLEEHRYVACYGRSRHQRNEFDKRKASRFREVSAYPTSDFLGSCHMCQKNLHGKDIYMYRGEKAFCSTECRDRQIMKDEYKEKCRIKVSRSTEVSKPPYSENPIFSTGIIVI